MALVEVRSREKSAYKRITGELMGYMRRKKEENERNSEEEEAEVFEWGKKSIVSTDERVFYEEVYCGKKKFIKGDCVLVRNDTGKGSWAAMIVSFYEGFLGEKIADLLWFERGDHVRREKREFPGIHVGI